MIRYLLITSILSSISYFSLTNEYMTAKNYEVTLIDKVQVNGTKYGQMYGVYKLKDGFVFDLPMSPTNYSQMQIGQTYDYSLRPMDVQQSRMENALYFFLPSLILAITFVYVIVVPFYLNLKNDK